MTPDPAGMPGANAPTVHAEGGRGQLSSRQEEAKR